MKIKTLILAITILAMTDTTYAMTYSSTEDKQPPAVALIDVILYRPLGLIATVTGSALFVAISPLTALAAISPPHDAFEKTADLLIVKPAKYTFDRPLDVYYPDDDWEYRRH